VELNTPISHKQAALLASHTSDPTPKSDLERLSQEDVYATVVLFKRTSIIDMLGDFHACNLAFVAYIDMLQHLKPRQYSVSSSFLAATGGEIIKITHDVLNTVSLSSSTREFHGVASALLSGLFDDDSIQCPTRTNFHCFHYHDRNRHR